MNSIEFMHKSEKPVHLAESTLVREADVYATALWIGQGGGASSRLAGFSKPACAVWQPLLLLDELIR